MLPVSYVINNLSVSYQERGILKHLILISLVSCILLIRFDFIYQIHYLQFLFFFGILFISSNLIDSVGSTLMSKIMPNSYGNNSNPAFRMIVNTTFGRFTGCCLITIFGIFGYKWIQFSIFFFVSICYILIYFFAVLKYNDLRVKAISRIIKKKYIC